MKLICLQENLKRGLNIVEKIIGKNSTLPILNNILLQTQQNYLKLSSTNLEMGINCWIPVKVEKEGSIAVPIKILSGFISNLPSEKVFLETKNLILSIKLLNYKAIINSESPKDFPIIPKITGLTIFNLTNEVFKKSLNQIIISASMVENRPEINGVFINITKKKIIIAATDSFRLSEKTIYLNQDLDQDLSFILPFRSAQELLRILSERTGDLGAILGKNQILFSIDGGNTGEPKIELISRLIDGNFPDYKQLIPKNFKTKVIMRRVDLLNAVKIGSVFSGRINDIKFNIFSSGEEIQISAKNFESGENISKVKADVSGDDLEITFNYRYIIDGLNSMVSDNIFLGFNGSSQPALIKPIDDKDYSYIVMPIRNQ